MTLDHEKTIQGFACDWNPGMVCASQHGSQVTSGAAEIFTRGLNIAKSTSACQDSLYPSPHLDISQSIHLSTHPLVYSATNDKARLLRTVQWRNRYWPSPHRRSSFNGEPGVSASWEGPHRVIHRRCVTWQKSQATTLQFLR